MRPIRFLVAVAAIAFACSASAQAEVKVGDKPDLTFKADSGENISLQSLHGKLVLVDFWATWCGPCMGEAGHMVKINQDFHDKGLQMIGISLDSDRNAMQQVVKAKGFDWPQFFDGQAWHNKFAVAFGVHGIPHTFLIGPDGTVLWEGHPAALDEPLAQAFKDHPPQLVDPKIISDASTQLDQIESAIKAGKGADAVKLWTKLPAEAMKDGAYATRAAGVQKELEKYGAKALADVDAQIAAKQYGLATAQLKQLVSAFAGLPCGADAAKRLTALMADSDAKAQFQAQEKAQASEDLLTAAQKFKADHKDALAYPKFKTIVKDYPGTPASDTAAQIVKTYEQDTALMKRINDDAVSGKANAMLTLARSYKSAGKPDLAAKKYQQIIHDFPDTSFAQTATKELVEVAP